MRTRSPSSTSPKPSHGLHLCRAGNAGAPRGAGAGVRRPAQARALHRLDPQWNDVSVGVSGGAADRRHPGADELPAGRRHHAGDHARCALPRHHRQPAAYRDLLRDRRHAGHGNPSLDRCREARLDRLPKPGRRAAGRPHGRADGVRRHRVPALYLGIDRNPEGHRAHPWRHDLGHRAQPDLLAARPGGSHDRGGADVSQERDARLGQAGAARRRLARHHAQLRSARLSAGARGLPGHERQRRAHHVRRDAAAEPTSSKRSTSPPCDGSRWARRSCRRS